jgi:CheY-like chemotaxis protein
MSTILVVDDSRLVLDAVRESLITEGHDVVLTENPLEVPHLIREKHPDLVLIDLNMPTMRGDIVARIIRKAFGSQVVVLLHTEAPDEAQKWIEPTGAEGVIAKSGDEAVVRDAVRLYLQRHLAARVG